MNFRFWPKIVYVESRAHSNRRFEFKRHVGAPRLRLVLRLRWHDMRRYDIHLGQAALGPDFRLWGAAELRLRLLTIQKLLALGFPRNDADKMAIIFWQRLERRGLLPTHSYFRRRAA